MSEQPWITPEEAAKEEGVSPRTIRRWAEQNRIPATRTPGGRWRITVTTTTTEGQQP